MKSFFQGIVGYIKSLLIGPFAIMIVWLLSERQRWKTRGKKPVVHNEAPYDGRRIMLLALYEKGTLRPDVIRLLKAARNEGLYILAVNTLKLTDPAEVEGLIDCYIERPNFGRDFGSYRTGFLHLFQRGWHNDCPRLLLINDSIFFSEERMPKFLSDMMGSEIEVLGSTENFFMEHHLGSFCIAMSGSVLRNPSFRTYWNNYKQTDLRPYVIKRGEMGLTKTLKRCASAPDQFKALYDTSRFLNALRHDPDFVDFTIRNGRTCDIIVWPRFSARKVIDFLQGRYLISAADMDDRKDLQLRVDSTLDELARMYPVNDSATLRGFVAKHLHADEQVDDTVLDDAIHSVLGDIFMQGGHIHQSPAPLIHLGLPIIKLDAIYRGTQNVYDTLRIAHLLQPVEADEYTHILTSRPFGGDTLTGWKRVAFMKGYI